MASLAYLEIRSRNEETINSTRIKISSLKVFYFLLYRRRYFYLFLNWFSTRISDDRKYVCSGRLYACINTRKFKSLDSREITSLPEIKKSDLHGTSFQSLPKINRRFITRPSAYNESLQYPTIAVLLIKILIFFDHSVVFTCSKVINAFKR